MFDSLTFNSLNVTIVQCLMRITPATRLLTGSRLLSTESLDMQVSTITSNGGKPQNMPQVIEDIGRSPLGNLGLANANMPGGNIFVPDSSMFHLKFRAGM